MPDYKLTYFKLTGRGELARLVFAEANVQYEDVRISPEEWAKIRSKAPFGQLPLLEVDGKMLCQNPAIGRYLANQFGLAGKTDWEKARCDMIMCCLEDFYEPVKFMVRASGDKQEELKEEYEQKQLPTSLSYLENILSENNGGDGYFVGDEVTYADLAFIHYYEFPRGFFKVTMPALDDKYPKLRALKARVESRPRIAKWLKERPADEF